MPLYMLIRPTKKRRTKETTGIQDYRRLKRMQANPAAPPGAIPCYAVESPQEFDEEGKELSPDAQVWKTYVREADQVDEELVDGWNKSMDVILIFAALFSAISTAFVIESYKSLKQDPADVSSQTLLAISQTLALIANGSQPATLPTSELDTPVFEVSAKAICVNVLWFLSLSLSVAVSLISMLAKEWCLEFMAGRSGPPGAQARRRQQRWDGLVGWKMKEVVVILPSLIHLSLLLFAIGLSVFMWDVHFGVAIPVVIVTILAAGAYFACTILPFLYDYCPYGTVLSRLYKQFKLVRSQSTQDGVKHDDVTAKALRWMIENCETPRSVDVALQSLAAAEETLPPKLLDECSAWSMIKQRLEYPDPQSHSEPNHAITSLYERALKSYSTVRRVTDQLDYGKNPETQSLEQLVLSVQSIINSAIHKVTRTTPSLDQTTTRILDQCALIGQRYLDRESIVQRQQYFHKPNVLAVDLGDLAGNLVECLERLQGGKISLELYNALSTSLAFTMCCITSRNPVENSATMGLVIRLLDISRSVARTATWASSPGKPTQINPVLGTLWMLISSDYSRNSNASAQTPHTSTKKALDTLWACAMSTVYMNESTLKRLDITYIAHGLLRLLINSNRWDLNGLPLMHNRLDLWDLLIGYDPSARIQSGYHAGYIEDITREVALGTNTEERANTLIEVLDILARRSPGKQTHLLPTPDIYVFLIKEFLDARAGVTFNNILNKCPFPKHSPHLAELLAESNLISQLSTTVDGGDMYRQAFAIAQLWLLFDMSLRAPERTGPALSTLEAALLQYPPLENNLDSQERVLEELETKLIALLEQFDQHALLYFFVPGYVSRVVELILQRRCAPLPEVISRSLENIPKYLRGITSFVNLEAERSVVYPDVEFDSEGWIIKSPKEERL